MAALAAVAEEGTFEAAARRRHVTPSAISQRVKTLEQRAGQVLVARTRPVRLPVAVNADSLSTWFPAGLRALPEGLLVDLRRGDQDHSATMPRGGTVLAAVTADPAPVHHVPSPHADIELVRSGLAWNPPRVRVCTDRYLTGQAHGVLTACLPNG